MNQVVALTNLGTNTCLWDVDTTAMSSATVTYSTDGTSFQPFTAPGTDCIA